MHHFSQLVLSPHISSKTKEDLLHEYFQNRTVIGVICILLALVICFGITPLFNRGISQKAEIVRVTKDIHAGELITKDMVTTAEVGSYNLPSGLMTTKTM